MSDWLLPFTSSDPDAPTGDGRPWGDGTAIAARARHSGGPPWDEGCTVTTLIGGHATMSAYHKALTDLIDHPGDGPAYSGGHWQRGHVYLAGWRLNAVRDLAPAGTDPWPTGQDPTRLQDSTAGLLLRLMQAGIQVRLLVWYPAAGSRIGAKLGPHIEDHQYLARVIGRASDDLTPRLSGVPGADPLGVVALDMRVCSWPAGAHHQKMMVIRSPRTNVAFVGGVDLALTRRDAPASEGRAPAAGDWQSGALLDSHVLAEAYLALAGAGAPSPAHMQDSDLPLPVYGQRQAWHDQHTRLEGPIVATIETQFAERWSDSGVAYVLSNGHDPGPGGWLNDSHQFNGQVFFSSEAAVDRQHSETSIVPLPFAALAPSVGGASTVQMWRTIPVRDRGPGSLFGRGEFTVMAGVSRAVSRAAQLIWIFDQYFWSRPLARQLNARLLSTPSLHLILVLPPHADTVPGLAHRARADALTLLVGSGVTDVSSRVAVLALWDWAGANVPGRSHGRGVYVHAKAQTYDGALLVCGSANLNRRSFTGDSELAVAVADPQVVLAHQQQLWQHLFASAAADQLDLPWPALDWSQADAGAKFFAAFRRAVGDPTAEPHSSRLIFDPWNADIPLPNADTPRDIAAATGPGRWWQQRWYQSLLESTSLPVQLEEAGRPLDEIVRAVETHVEPDGARLRWPERGVTL